MNDQYHATLLSSLEEVAIMRRVSSIIEARSVSTFWSASLHFAPQLGQYWKGGINLPQIGQSSPSLIS